METVCYFYLSGDSMHLNGREPGVIRPMWRRLPDFGPGKHENRSKIVLAMLVQGFGVA